MKALLLVLLCTGIAHAETIHVSKELGSWNLEPGSDEISEYLAYESDGSARSTNKNEVMESSKIRAWVEDQKVRFLIGKDYIKLDDVPDGVSFDLSYTPGMRAFKASAMTAPPGAKVDGSGYAILGEPGPKAKASCRSNGVTWMLPMVLLFLLLKRKEEV